MQKTRLIVCLRSGGDYDERYVHSLHRQVEHWGGNNIEFVALTDVPNLGDPLVRNWPGWWCLIEAFRFTGPCIMIGLDTVIVDSLEPFVELSQSRQGFWMKVPLNRRQRHGPWSSMITIWNGDYRYLFQNFRAHKHIPQYTYEQIYTAMHVPDIGAVDDFVDGMYSYKKHCRNGLPNDARVIFFHGKPRPHEVSDSWVWLAREGLFC